MTTITIPRETFDQMRDALEIAEKHLAYVEIFEALSAAKAVEPHTSGDYALGYAEGFNDACKPAAKEVQPQAQEGST